MRMFSTKVRRSALAVLALALGVVVGVGAGNIGEVKAGAQGSVAPTLDAADITVNDTRTDFNGYPGGSYDFGEVIEVSVAVGAAGERRGGVKHNDPHIPGYEQTNPQPMFTR